MRSPDAEASVAAYLSSAPGPRKERPAAAPGGVDAVVQHGGGQGAVPSSIRFRRDRALGACHIYAVSFSTGEGPPWLMIVRAFQGPDSTWVVAPLPGARTPGRRRPGPCLPRVDVGSSLTPARCPGGYRGALRRGRRPSTARGPAGRSHWRRLATPLWQPLPRRRPRAEYPQAPSSRPGPARQPPMRRPRRSRTH